MTCKGCEGDERRERERAKVEVSEAADCYW
jgi:hypothetical protein